MYKNNNGNYSLRLVPIHRLQPRPPTVSDYCYCGRMHCRSYDLCLQPWAFGFCLLQQNLPAVRLFLSFGWTFPDEVSFRPGSFPEGSGSRFRSLVAEAICSLLPCDSIVERTFPVFDNLMNTRGRSGTGSLHSYSGSSYAQSRRSG